MDRFNESLKNIKYSLGSQLIILILSFLTRTIFVYKLNQTYLGINGLFTNIISILSLSELGIGTAITFSLYQPLASNDYELISKIMKVFRKSYMIIGFIILCFGTIFSFNLNILINSGDFNIKNIQFIFMLYILTSSSSYFFSYKRLLLIADRKKYIDSIYQTVFSIITSILQIIVLYFFSNYEFYLIIKLLTTFMENVMISSKIDKIYPYIDLKIDIDMPLNKKREIRTNIQGSMFHKLGGVLVMSTDNLIISKFVGLHDVAIYSNYLLIINALNLLINQMFSSITSIIGNFGVTNSKDSNKKVFEILDFLNFWIYCAASICLYILFNDFISIWLGNSYLFPESIVFILCFNFFLNGRRNSVITYKSAYGLFWQDRYKPILESLVNLLFSIILIKIIGTKGVFIGTLFSIIVNTSIEPFVLFKYGFSTALKDYYKKYFKYLISYTLILLLTILMVSPLNVVGFLSFSIKTFITILIPNIILIIFYRNKKEFKYLFRKILKRV